MPTRLPPFDAMPTHSATADRPREARMHTPVNDSGGDRPRSGSPAPDYELVAWVERESARQACNWFGFCHLCAHARCRRANGCRGDAMACLRRHVAQVRRHVAQVPAPARSWVRGIMEAQDDGLTCDEALDDMAEFADGYFCWIAGLKQCARA
jgi:hypothetical protein